MKCNRCGKTLLGNEYQNHYLNCFAKKIERFRVNAKKKKTLKSKVKNQAELINALQKKILNLKTTKKPATLKPIRKTNHWVYDSEKWKQLRYPVFKKFGFKCLACNATNTELHIDHIVPISVDRSKAFDMDNLQVLCKGCNLSKSNKHQDDLRFK